MKNKISNKIRLFCKDSLRVGWFLAARQIRRSSKWTTSLIIFVMVLTFLNLVFVSGILSGLVEGSSIAYRSQYSGDLILSNYESDNYIKNTKSVIETLASFSEVVSITPRILSGALVEANYANKKSVNDKPDSLSAVLAGIDPVAEDRVTHLSDLVEDGEYLSSEDRNEVLIGSNLLSEYSRNVPGDETLADVSVGDTIRVKVGNIFKELKIKGVIKSKVGEVGQRIYMTDKFLRQLIERPSGNANEIAAVLTDDSDPDNVKEALKQTQICDCAKIETWEESQGQFFKDISRTFVLLGALIGGIGVAVASITVFIVIFINAITRRRYIGILKGIGICSSSIQVSYMIQSLFYSFCGSIIGSLILFGILKPFIDQNPIDFPFSDGILVAPIGLTLIRIAVLMGVTIIAGYIPAKLIVRKNTLDSILGR
jgi:ABC-type lipoprotein release transport system permease subunit